MTNQIATIKPSDEVLKSLSENGITPTLIEELKKFQGLTVDASISDGMVVFNKEQLNAVSEGRKKIKSTRVLIEKTCKAMRDVHTAINREISSKEDEMVDLLSPIETALLIQEKKVEDLKKQIADEQEKKAEETFRLRVTKLEGVGFQSKDFGLKYQSPFTEISTTEIRVIDEPVFDGFLKKATDDFNAEQQRLAKIEQERLEAEAKFKEQQEKQAAEQARLDAIRIAQEKKEQELKDAALKLEHEKEMAAQQKIISRHNQLSSIGLHFDGLFSHEYSEASTIKIKHADIDFISDEQFTSILNDLKTKVEKQRAIDAEEKAKQIEAEKAAAAEQSRLDEIARAKQQAEEKQEQERMAAEQAAKKELRKSDKKKLVEFSQMLIHLERPSMKSEEAHKLIEQALNDIQKIAQEIAIASKDF